MYEIIPELYTRYPELQGLDHAILETFSILRDSVNGGGKILVCGNGGSASDSEHMVGELLKSFMMKRPIDRRFHDQFHKLYGAEGVSIADALESGIKAISLVSQSAFITAYSNDVDPDAIFAQQVFVYGDPGDVLVAFSTSGNSNNIIYAIKTAVVKDMKTVLFTGSDGGKAAKFAECSIKVPADKSYSIQEYHLPIYHAICAMLEQEFYGKLP